MQYNGQINVHLPYAKFSVNIYNTLLKIIMLFPYPYILQGICLFSPIYLF